MSRLTGKAAWQDPMKTKTFYMLTEESFKAGDRVGNCWAKGRLKPGDIVLCDELSGDCFYKFYLVDFTDFANSKGVHMRLVPYPFGAYALKATVLKEITERDYHLLRAGEQVEVMANLTNN